MHLYDVIVVGAGPSGCLTASILSKNGLKVLLINKSSNRYNGEKLGIASSRTLDLLGASMSDSILANIHDMHVKNNGNVISLEFEEPELYIFKMRKLYSALLEECAANSVDIRDNETVIDIKMETCYAEVRTGSDTYKSRLVVGADGVNSIVGKKTGIITGQDYCIGIEALYKTDNISYSQVEIELSNIPGGYAMALKYEKLLSIYAISFSREKLDIKKYFRNYITLMGLKDSGAYYLRGNLIPQNNGKRQNFTNKRAVLVGAAAGIGNPFTGIGLYYAMRSSMICSELILSEAARNELGPNSLNGYNEAISRDLLKEMRVLHRSSRLFYNNKYLLFKSIKYIPYAGRYFASLICGKINSSYSETGRPKIPGTIKNGMKNIRIIK